MASIIDNIEALEDNPKYMDAKFNDMLRSWLKELADELPKDKPLWYASKEMKPYRDSIDMIAKWLIDGNPEALKADEAFRKELREKKEKLQDKMGAWYKEQAEKELDRVQNLKGYEEVVVSTGNRSRRKPLVRNSADSISVCRESSSLKDIKPCHKFFSPFFIF